MTTKVNGNIVTTLIVAMLVITIIGVIAFNMRAVRQINLYGHGEEIAVDGSPNYMQLKTSLPDGTAKNETIETVNVGCISFGNYSLISLANICTDFKDFEAGTWVCRYRAVANVSEKAKCCLNASIIWGPSYEATNQTLYPCGGGGSACCCCATTNITTSWATHSGTCDLTGTNLPSDLTDLYLKIDWAIYKYDATKLNVTIQFDDPTLESDEHTGIYSVDSDCLGLTGTNRTIAMVGWLFMYLAIALTAIYTAIGKKR